MIGLKLWQKAMVIANYTGKHYNWENMLYIEHHLNFQSCFKCFGLKGIFHLNMKKS